MPWYRKELPTPFDATPMAGLSFLNGNVLARVYQQAWLAEQKYPLVTFPSGLARECAGRDDAAQVIHVFGALQLSYQSNRDQAYEQAQASATEHSYQVIKQRDNGLTIANPATGRGYHIRYDNEARQMVNITRFPKFAMELLDGQSRALLPKLYANEQQGSDAVAPVKFFTPDSSWSWYASEFDGNDLFFGLVSGWELELGYFSLSELEGVRGGLGLPVERDLYYQPQSLAALQQKHRRG